MEIVELGRCGKDFATHKFPPPRGEGVITKGGRVALLTILPSKRREADVARNYNLRSIYCSVYMLQRFFKIVVRSRL